MPPPPPPFLEPLDPSALDEARAFNAKLEQLLARQPSIHTLPPEVTRRVRRAGGGIFPPPVYLPQARDLTIPGRAGDIRLRVIPPSRPPSGVYLHLHGGGWTLGSADMQDPALAALAEATGLCAVSVDYRLAPEHPFPAAAVDCEDAASWLLDGGAAQLGAPACFTLGGDSAGAHLAVLTLLRLRERWGSPVTMGAPPPNPRSGLLPFAAANLVFGAYDLAMTPSSRLWGDRNLVLSLPIMRFFTEGFLPGLDPEARRAPTISPLYADLRGLPPALFTVGTLDPLLDDTLFMAARWRAAGSPAELRVWPEAIHGFTAFPLAVARAANDAQHAFLRASVG